jgi:molecular chaperone GrpE (heat shock protein)
MSAAGIPGRPAARAERTAVTDRLTDLSAELAAVRRLVSTLDERTAARERAIDRLQADVEHLRAGAQHLLVRPFLIDLQRLRDDLLRQAVAVRAEVTAVDLAALLESFAYSVEQTLARGGIEVLRPEIGSAFDATRHRVAGAVAAARADLDGTVAEVVSDGYLDITADRPLTSATVRVYRCAAADSPAS